MADLNTDELAKAFRDAAIAANDHARAQETAQKASLEYAAMQEQATKEVDAAGKKMRESLKANADAFGKNAVDFGKAMVTGSEGTAKYAGAITGAADAAGSAAATLLTSFGPLGMIVGGVIKAFGSLMGASLKQNDNLMKSYRELSNVGSVSGSLEKLQEDLNKVGLESKKLEDIDKFTKLIGQNAVGLSAFGGSVSAGKDKFTELFKTMIGEGNKVEIAMQRIGYSTDDMRDATADYVTKQSRLGLAQGKTSEQLRVEATKYMVTLRELGELTGMSRDEAQKAIAEQQNNAKLQLYFNDMREKGQAKEAAALEEFVVGVKNRYGDKGAKGLIEQIVNMGAPVGEASAAIYTATQNQMYLQAISFSKGMVGLEGALQNVGKGMQKNMNQVKSSFYAAGDTMENVTGDNALLMGMITTKNKQSVDIAGDLAKTMANGGKRLNENISIEQRERAARIAADKLLMDVGNTTVGMFERLTDIMFKFGKFLAQSIDKLSGWIGKKTNYAEGFKDKEDFKGDLKIATDEKRLAQEKAIRISKELDDISKDPTGKVLKEKIALLEKQVIETRGTAVIDQVTGNLTGEVTGRDDLANAQAQQKLAELKALKEEITTRRGQTENIRIDKVNAIKERELLKLKTQTAEADKKIKDAEKNLANFTAVGSSASATAAQNTAGGAVAAAGPLGSAERNAARSSAAAGLSQAGAGREAEILKKLNLKGGQGGQAVQGGKADPALLALAEKIQSAFPGGYFSSLNDNHHKNKKNSKHPLGKALDFVLPQDTAPKTAEEAAAISEALRDLGGSGIRDEYFKDYKPGESTGGHFHVEVARNGGAFSGPNAGYPVMLHGKNDSPESVWPEKKLKGMLDEVKKGSIEDYKKELLADMNMSKPATDITSMPTNNSDGVNRMMEVLSAKFDDMISQLETSNGTLNNLLTYAKA